MSDDISAPERSELLHLLNDSEAKAHFDKLLDELGVSQLPLHEQPETKARQIFASITGHKEVATPVKQMKPYLYYAAASIILLIIADVFYFKPQTRETQIAHSTLIKTEPKTRRYLLLPDSSKVILNTGSSLTFDNFTGKTREVHLSGEAFFDIKHNPQKPFIVHTGRIKTTVLGTAFNIRADSSSHITVTVSRGKVKVEDGTKPLALLLSNQQVTVDTFSGRSISATVNAAAVTEWNRKDLKFDDTPLSEVALAVETRFGLPIVFSDPALKDNHVTAEFIRNESLEEILQVITKINGMQYAIDKEKVTISSK